MDGVNTWELWCFSKRRKPAEVEGRGQSFFGNERRLDLYLHNLRFEFGCPLLLVCVYRNPVTTRNLDRARLLSCRIRGRTGSLGAPFLQEFVSRYAGSKLEVMEISSRYVRVQLERGWSHADIRVSPRLMHKISLISRPVQTNFSRIQSSKATQSGLDSLLAV